LYSLAGVGISVAIRTSSCHALHVPETHFDEWIAQRYRTLWPELYGPDLPDSAVELLAEMAGPGPVLELGIGTGRLALPLSRRGVRVHGIELSAAMVAHLRSEEGASEIEVTVGDMSTTTVG
jgi:predicted TPR repeat methyltransferase